MHEYRVIRSKRKTLSISIADDSVVTVRAPLFYTKKSIDKLVEKNSGWIEKQLKYRKNDNMSKPLSNEQINELKKSAKTELVNLTEYYADIIDVHPEYIKITGAKKRFGSCTAKNGICYSYRLMLYPKEAIEYVVVHELCHLKVKNHSKKFYALVSEYMPDYKQRQALLKRQAE